MASAPASVLAINGGSSSIKFAVYQAGTLLKPSVSGMLDWIDRGGTTLSWRATAGVPFEGHTEVPDDKPSIGLLIDWLDAREELAAVRAVGHRVVHGMADAEPERITPDVLDELRRATSYAPDHLPCEVDPESGDRNANNVRVFSPDETTSDRWGAVFEVTNRCSTAEILRVNGTEEVMTEIHPGMVHSIRPDFGDTRLDALQRHAFGYFLNETNVANGLVADRTQPGAPASIAAVGFALAAYPVGVERGWMTRIAAIERTLALLRFFWTSPQGTAPDMTGYKGFYYHFLDMRTGARADRCELSTVDTSFLLAGMLAAAAYFDQDSEAEQEIRTLADALYRRADWPWACNGGATVTHGWKPESGFLPYRWEGYDEAMLLYALGLGSPTYPLPTESYAAWTSSYLWKDIDGYEVLYGGPLFIHQYSHVFVDFRGIQDAFAREKGIDYCENSRRATYVQQAYAIRNPLEFAGYGQHFWGLTASDGPGWTTQRIRGIERAFFDYVARGAPYGPDDGTVAPWAAVASLPFAPEIVLPTLQHFQDVYPQVTGEYCLRCSFNLTFPHDGDAGLGWTSPYHFGINLGPVVLMCENYRSGLLWRLLRACPYVVTGLRRAGFTKGWL